MSPQPPAEREDASAPQELELHVGDLDQLFNSIDPAPFRERDLDPKAEEFIVGWAQERGDGPLSLKICIDRALKPDEEKVVPGAVQEYFKERGAVTRQRLRQLFRVGRTSLVIGLLFLAASILVGDLLEAALRATRFGSIVRESLLIGGWVAMWKPLEVFLYDWWPIRAEARLFDRLSAMRVRLERDADGHPHESARPLRSGS
ncbi:MAG: hypothetical protein ACRD2N_09610 [Vicinamibacterales bacterium]